MRCATAIVLFLWASTAAARSSREVSYEYDRVWPALVRFLRVDERLKITEKDAAAGYVLFDFSDGKGEKDGKDGKDGKEGKRSFPGAAELSRTLDATGRSATRVVIRIADRPDYIESALLERFTLKLREELGEPSPPPPSPPPTTQPDSPPKEEDDAR